MKTTKLLVLLLLVINVPAKSQSGGASGTNYVISGASSGSTYGGTVTAGGYKHTSYDLGGDVIIGGGNGGYTAGSVILNAGIGTGSAESGKITLNALPSSGGYGGGIVLNGRTNVNNTLTANSLTVNGPINSLINFANGKVGIGTANPVSKLHVYGPQSWHFDTDVNLRVTNWALAGPNTVAFNAYNDNESSNVPMAFSGSLFYFHYGKVGIGIASPEANLHLMGTSTDASGKTFIIGSTSGSHLRMGYHTNYSWIQSCGSKPLYINQLGNNVIFNSGGGSVCIGTTDPKGYKLAVAGSVVAVKIVVKPQANWPDYVFSENHKMKTLAETEAFIKEKKHLEGFPTTKEVHENGVDLGEMNVNLLKKIEEITLVLIEQNKQIIGLKQQNEKFRERLGKAGIE